MSAGSGGDRFGQLEQAYHDYTVYDQHYEKIGKVDDIFVDANDEPEYIGVKTGFLGMKSTLIPIELVRVNDRRKLLEVAADEETIKHAPTFDDDGDITPDYEHRVHAYFGLERPAHMQSSGSYGSYYDSPTDAAREEELRRSVDTEYGERAEPSTSSPVSSTGPSNTGGADVPLEDTTSSPTPEEPAASTASPLDADAAIRTGGDTRKGIEVEGGTTEVKSDSKVRIYKRAARPVR